MKNNIFFQITVVRTGDKFTAREASSLSRRGIPGRIWPVLAQFILNFQERVNESKLSSCKGDYEM